MRLSDARTTDEILAAAANFVWYEAHKARPARLSMIPTEADLVRTANKLQCLGQR